MNNKARHWHFLGLLFLVFANCSEAILKKGEDVTSLVMIDAGQAEKIYFEEMSSKVITECKAKQGTTFRCYNLPEGKQRIIALRYKAGKKAPANAYEYYFDSRSIEKLSFKSRKGFFYFGKFEYVSDFPWQEAEAFQKENQRRIHPSGPDPDAENQRKMTTIVAQIIDLTFTERARVTAIYNSKTYKETALRSIEKELREAGWL